MNKERALQTNTNTQVEQAVAELRTMIQERYPSAAFVVSQGDDPQGTYLIATVDVEDTDTVVNVVIDRLLSLQIEEHLPVYVIPLHSEERLVAMRKWIDQFPREAAVKGVAPQ